MTKSTTIVAFDQHAATTVAAVLLPGQRTPALHSLTSDSPTILRFVERLARPGPVRCCYEAGPCGFELQRALTAQAIPCDVIAPALIPRRPGRSRQDRSARCGPARGALSRRARSRRFTFPPSRKKRRAICCAVAKTSAPISCAPAIGSRSFCCATAAASPRRRRRGRNATPRGCRPSAGRCRRSSRRIAPTSARSTKPSARLQAVDTELRDLLTLEPLRARVERLRCFRGIDDLTALTIAAELGDARRFPSAPERDGASPAWCRRSIPAARSRRAARSPKPAMRISDASSSNPPGITGIIRFSGRRSGSVSAGAPARRHRARVARAASAASSLSPPRRARQTQTTHRHRGRARAHRLSVGRADPVI